MAKKTDIDRLTLLPHFAMRTLVIAFLALLLPLQAFAAEVYPVSPQALQYAAEIGAIMPNQYGEPESGRMMTRLEFTLAVTHVLYPHEYDDGCFRDLSPRKAVTFTHLFGDVEKDTWYGKKLCIAMRAGLIRGDSKGNFRPFDTITVGEASRIMSQAYGFLYPSKNPSGLPWYWTSMEALRMRGALDTAFIPTDLVTSDMTAQMFYALRTAERYPSSRMIGFTPAPVTLAALMNDAVPVTEEPGQKTAKNIGYTLTVSMPTVTPRKKSDMRVLKKSPRLLRQALRK